MRSTKTISYGFGILLVTLSFGLRAYAETEYYQWTDKAGRLHFAQDLHGVPERIRQTRQFVKREEFGAHKTVVLGEPKLRGRGGIVEQLLWSLNPTLEGIEARNYGVLESIIKTSHHS